MYYSGRGVGHNIIPTTTGASKAVALVLPELAGKFAGLSVRVPTNNVSMVDLTVRLERPAESKEALLHPLREAAAGRRKWSIAPLSNVIAVCDEELVSHDFLGREESCIVDVAATLMLDPHTFKVIAWVSLRFDPRAKASVEQKPRASGLTRLELCSTTTSTPTRSDASTSSSTCTRSTTA